MEITPEEWEKLSKSIHLTHQRIEKLIKAEQILARLIKEEFIEVRHGTKIGPYLAMDWCAMEISQDENDYLNDLAKGAGHE